MLNRKTAYKESAQKNYNSRVNELQSLGNPRTEIELIDIWGEPDKAIWYYRYIRCGNGIDVIPPNLCLGHISSQCRGIPVAHVIRDLTHDEFVEIAEAISASLRIGKRD